jgi:hypothetical protein
MRHVSALPNLPFELAATRNAINGGGMYPFTDYAEGPDWVLARGIPRWQYGVAVITKGVCHQSVPNKGLLGRRPGRSVTCHQATSEKEAVQEGEYGYK